MRCGIDHGDVYLKLKGDHQEKPLFLTCNLLEPIDLTIILLSKAATSGKSKST